MDGFTWVDGAVAGIVLVSAILAYARGFVREAMAILGWILAAVAAFALAGVAEGVVREGIRLIPRVGPVVAESCELSILASFTAVFAVSLLLISLFTPLLSGAVRDSVLGPADRVAGFLFGVARGLLLVAVAFVAYDRITVGAGAEAVDNSRSAAVFSRLRGGIEAEIPEDAPGWILLRYETLVGDCGAPAVPVEGAAPIR